MMTMIMIFRCLFGTETEVAGRKPSTPLTIYFVRPKFKRTETAFTPVSVVDEEKCNLSPPLIKKVLAFSRDDRGNNA